jgi:hypothetical protein
MEVGNDNNNPVNANKWEDFSRKQKRLKTWLFFQKTSLEAVEQKTREFWEKNNHNPGKLLQLTKYVLIE